MTPFTMLFDDAGGGDGLPEDLRSVYGGDWTLPATRPYVYANFAVSRDGRVSFALPGQLGGGEVSGFNPHDRWLMGLLRARADAVMVGDGTLRLEPDHLWTCEYISPDEPAFPALRRLEGRRTYPLLVVLSLEGMLDAHAAAMQTGGLHVLVATTARGAERAQGLSPAARLEVLALGETSVDLRRLVAVLAADYGVRTLLCEGGPRAYGALLAAGVVDEEFVTLCPLVIGNDAASPRPGLVEGAAFTPETAPRSQLLSLRRAGEHLFLRSSYRYPG